MVKPNRTPNEAFRKLMSEQELKKASFLLGQSDALNDYEPSEYELYGPYGDFYMEGYRDGLTKKD